MLATEDTIQNSKEPLATVLGEDLVDLPQDLYIPPGALSVFLENFSGPLDLLLYLIKKENLNILDIPIAKITAQYIEYINLMQEFQLELAGEYLLMAAMLAEIKSRLLLPKMPSENNNEEDPRAELVRKLQEYERYKKLAENLDKLPRLERENFVTNAEALHLKTTSIPPPEVKLEELLKAFRELLTRAKHFEHHFVRQATLSVRERMSHILVLIQKEKFTTFEKLFTLEEGRSGVVVTFIALLELLKQRNLQLVQNELFGTIYVKI